MQITAKYLAILALSIAVSFTSGARAMPLPQYDKMAKADQTLYQFLLVEGVQDALEAHGKSEQAKKLRTIFLDGSDNGGARQITTKLVILRAINKENAADPKNTKPVYEVEHGFMLMLKDNGIKVPLGALLEINKDFKPGKPPPERFKKAFEELTEDSKAAKSQP